MFNITYLKVFEFENGEKECVIAKDYQEAYDYYKESVGEDIEFCNITQIENWFNIRLKCETLDKQEDGTYFKFRNMAEVAQEMYQDGYTGAEIISSTVYY